MGIYYSAKIVVGLPGSEFDSDDVENIYNGEPDLEIVTGYYDGDWEHAVIGVTVYGSSDYSASELDYKQEHIDQAKSLFKDLTGKEGKVYLTPYGW